VNSWRKIRYGVTTAVGIPAAIGIGLTAGALVYVLAIVVPAYSALHDATKSRHEEHAFKEGRTRFKEDANSKAKSLLDRFYGSLHTVDDLESKIEEIYAIAAEFGLEPKQAKYQVSDSDDGLLVRFVLECPLQGSYRQIRMFIQGALAKNNMLALESVTFQRPEVKSSVVEAKIRFVLFLRSKAK